MGRTLALVLGFTLLSCHDRPAQTPAGAAPGASAPPVASAPVAPLATEPAPTSPGLPSAPPPASDTVTQTWEGRLSRLYSSYSKRAEVRAAALRELFAPRVRQFLGLSDVSVEQVILAVDQFFQSRPNPYYEVERHPKITQHAHGTSVRATVAAKWEETCPEEWGQEYWICEREQNLRVQLEANAEDRVVELVESQGRKNRYRAVVELAGYEEPLSRCEDPSTLTSTITISQGTVVEATGHAIFTGSCGACEYIRQFVHHGVTFWAVTSACITTYEGEHGPSTGGEDPLELLP